MVPSNENTPHPNPLFKQEFSLLTEWIMWCLCWAMGKGCDAVLSPAIAGKFFLPISELVSVSMHVSSDIRNSKQ